MYPGWIDGFRDLFLGKRIFWQCFFGGYCVGLDRLLPIDLVASLDEGSDFDLIREHCGIRFTTIEEPGVRRFNWIGSGIEVVPQRCGRQIESNLGAHPRDDWWITSTPASKQLEAFCSENGYRYVGPVARTASRFKHKQRLYDALEELDLPRTGGEWLGLAGRGIPEFRSQFGARFVLQAALGAAGSGTYLIGDEADLESAALKLGDTTVYAAPHLGDLSLNINAAVIAGLACIGFPNVQLSGVEQLATPWGGYCGNDYSAASRVEATVVRDVQAQTERIGEWLAKEGFDGFYGLDFVIGEDDGRAYAIDLNPRWQGSTALSIQAELAGGRLPLAVAEFAHRCGVLDRKAVESHREDFSRPLIGAQMCLRTPATPDNSVREAVAPGLYRSAEFLRPAFRLEDCTANDVWLLTGGVPRKGTHVEPGAWLARICTGGGVAGSTSAKLSPWASQVAALAYRKFGLSP